jgi:hypothetical protein
MGTTTTGAAHPDPAVSIAVALLAVPLFNRGGADEIQAAAEVFWVRHAATTEDNGTFRNREEM